MAKGKMELFWAYTCLTEFQNVSQKLNRNKKKSYPVHNRKGDLTHLLQKALYQEQKINKDIIINKFDVMPV